MQNKVADLHVHTYLSDGTLSPRQVLESAKTLNLACIAITDHDAIDGIKPAMDLAHFFGIEVIPGVELSAEIGNNEIHIIGYFIDWKDKDFQAKLKVFCQSRTERIGKMTERLTEHGIEIDPEDVFKLAGAGSVGRLHLAQVMWKKGFVRSVNEAFQKYINNGGPCYVKKFTLSPKEAIELIHSVGGIAILAHPHLLKNDNLISGFIGDGLDGIEVYHSDHPDPATKYYESFARKHGLLITGGSDCHGLGKGKPLMGKVRIPYELVRKLKEAYEARRR